MTRLFSLQDRIDDFTKGSRAMLMKDPWKHSKEGVFKNAEGMFEAHCRVESMMRGASGKLKHVFVGAYDTNAEAVKALSQYKDLAEKRAMIHRHATDGDDSDDDMAHVFY